MAAAYLRLLDLPAILSDAEYRCAILVRCDDAVALTASGHPDQPRPAAVHGAPPIDLDAFVARVGRIYPPLRPFEMISVAWSNQQPSGHWHRTRWDGIRNHSGESLEGEVWIVAWTANGRTDLRAPADWLHRRLGPGQRSRPP